VDQKEAQVLYRLIVAERGDDSARVQKLGNNEHVVVIERTNFFCWSEADYLAYTYARTCGVCTKETPHLKECVSCQRLTCAVCRRIKEGVRCLDCVERGTVGELRSA
jgi:hypothetical protein